MKTKRAVMNSFDVELQEEEINQLYHNYRKKVYGLVFSYVKDSYLAEDLTHEILVKCYVTHHQFKGNCSISTWIYRITKNHCIDFLRKAYHHRDLLYEDFELFYTEKDCTPESELLKNYESDALRYKINQLPTKYQAVIIHFYYQGHSMKEIAHHLSVKLTTVKTRLYRAKKMLKSMY